MNKTAVQGSADVEDDPLVLVLINFELGKRGISHVQQVPPELRVMNEKASQFQGGRDIKSYLRGLPAFKKFVNELGDPADQYVRPVRYAARDEKPRPHKPSGSSGSEAAAASPTGGGAGGLERPRTPLEELDALLPVGSYRPTG